jgi:glycosyltransferase 2 family protein
MNARWRRWSWPVAKAFLAVAIVVAVGWQFWHDLQREQLQIVTPNVGWLALSAGLYLLGMGFSACFWYRLLRVFGERPTWPVAVRAYYLSQLGKYLPGKAWALMMRGTLVRGPDVKLGVALIATFYEVLTMMASGALLAAVLFAVAPPALVSDTVDPHWLGLCLAAVCGVPLLPAVFNRLVGRLAQRFQKVESFRLPRLGPLTWEVATRYTSIQALAWVAGFLAVVVPGGFGVREWLLNEFLGPELAGHGGGVVVIVLLFRLVGMAAELILAAGLWWLPGPRRTAA